MKAIILAAGQGNRMRKKTNNKPKCMLVYNNKTLINYTIEAMQKCNINDIVIINGYKSNKLEGHLKNEKVRFIKNNKYFETNMVYTFFCAENEMNDDLIISYSDIIYNKNILNKLKKNSHDIAVVVDKNWRNLWEIRMENPLEDAETMKIDNNGNIIELGKRAKDYSDINGQYIGLIKISKNYINNIRKFYHNLDKNILYDGKSFNNMYMTSFIQLIIENLSNVNAEVINGGWLEFDTEYDIINYAKNNLII
jgi:choline kinase